MFMVPCYHCGRGLSRSFPVRGLCYLFCLLYYFSYVHSCSSFVSFPIPVLALAPILPYCSRERRAPGRWLGEGSSCGWWMDGRLPDAIPPPSVALHSTSAKRLSAAGISPYRPGALLCRCGAYALTLGCLSPLRPFVLLFTGDYGYTLR